MIRNRIYRLYKALLKKHGKPIMLWPQWCSRRKTLETREKIIIGAMLTQHTSWHNADLALQNLKHASLLSLKTLANKRNFLKVQRLIRSAGFYTIKPRRLCGLASFIVKQYGNLENFMKADVETARKELLGLYGIGPETADTILLYGLGKLSFVIDEYTKRFVRKHKLSRVYTYDYLKQLFEKDLHKSINVYQDFHALIIFDQKGKEGSKMERA